MRCALAQLGKKPHAHSDYVGQHGPMVLYGLQRDIDVMVRVAASTDAPACASHDAIHYVSAKEFGADAASFVQIEAKAKELALLQYRRVPAPSLKLCNSIYLRLGVC